MSIRTSHFYVYDACACVSTPILLFVLFFFLLFITIYALEKVEKLFIQVVRINIARQPK